MRIKRIIRPPDFFKVRDGTPIIFTAGPIQGARDWQNNEAIPLIDTFCKINNVECIVACPRRLIESEDHFNDDDFEIQTTWETLYLRQASRNGVILFGLAKPEVNVPGRAYAQTTRFELGEWLERSRRGLVRIAIAIEAGFSGERYIRERITSGCYPHVSIYSDIKTACDFAVRFCRS